MKINIIIKNPYLNYDNLTSKININELIIHNPNSSLNTKDPMNICIVHKRLQTPKSKSIYTLAKHLLTKR